MIALFVADVFYFYSFGLRQIVRIVFWFGPFLRFRFGQLGVLARHFGKLGDLGKLLFLVIYILSQSIQQLNCYPFESSRKIDYIDIRYSPTERIQVRGRIIRKVFTFNLFHQKRTIIILNRLRQFLMKMLVSWATKWIQVSGRKISIFSTLWYKGGYVL